MTACNIFDPRPTTYYDENGRVATGALAYFYEAETSTPITVYTDTALTTAHAFPVVANSRGVFPPIYIDYASGPYRAVIKSSAGIILNDAAYIPNEAPPSSGGGVSVTETQIFRTGFAMWVPQTGPIDGFVRMNGRTIGSASSGATEYAAAGAEDLFTWIWSKIGDTYAPVSSGRGISAAVDWAANKTIVVPSMQGRAPIGADDMGGSAANVIQVSTTISVTSGSPTATVTSAVGLARGMICIIDVSNTAVISSISGTTVTFTANYSGATNAGASLRASFFSDAQLPGASGGSQTITQTSAEMPAHDHDWDDPGHHHTDNELLSVAGSGPAYTGSAITVQPSVTGDSTTGITFNSAGSGLPTKIVQPSMIGTFYIKL